MARTPRAVAPAAEPAATATALIDCAGELYIGLSDAAGQVRVTYEPDLPGALCVGRDLEQVGTSGLSRRPGKVCVGPADPVYVAINVAWQRGATHVEISSASEAQQRRLSPWLEKVADRIAVQFI